MEIQGRTLERETPCSVTAREWDTGRTAITASGKNCSSLSPLAIGTALYLNPPPTAAAQHQAQTSKDLAEQRGTEVFGQFLPFMAQKSFTLGLNNSFLPGVVVGKGLSSISRFVSVQKLDIKNIFLFYKVARLLVLTFYPNLHIKLGIPCFWKSQLYLTFSQLKQEFVVGAFKTVKS